MVSAMCHDIGHPGLNNLFLVETGHAMALRYNDKSPLENMHCAMMFDICRQDGKDVFMDFDDEPTRRDIRRVSIDAILLTDYTNDFTIVKEVTMIYETHGGLFDNAREMYKLKQAEYPSREAAEVFNEEETRETLRNVILHLCDVSTASKPWALCQIWANMVMTEYFNQGDREKELGLCVQHLNDREKNNVPHSQVCFIEFFVAPLYLSVSSLMPPMQPAADQLLANLDNWCSEWMFTSGVDEEEQVKVVERITKLVKKFNGLDVTHHTSHPSRLRPSVRPSGLRPSSLRPSIRPSTLSTSAMAMRPSLSVRPPISVRQSLSMMRPSLSAMRSSLPGLPRAGSDGVASGPLSKLMRASGRSNAEPPRLSRNDD